MPASADSGHQVFRSGRSRLSLCRLLSYLRDSVAELSPHTFPERIYAALLRAGELECSLRDCNSDLACGAEQMTDAIAELAVARDRRSEISGSMKHLENANRLLERLLRLSGRRGPNVTVCRPEGFAYYALHPLDYADLVARSDLKKPAFVIGIRSIGTTLSAVVAAALRDRGVGAIRTTVRPFGHPYNRRCEFTAAQLVSILGALRHGTDFLVCDEGPGRSGSSFLSVAEALEDAGVPRHSIVLLCAYQPDVEALCAPQAPQRWSRYRARAAGITRRLPHDAGTYLGAGEWRSHLLSPAEAWPASWTQMERLKYFTADGSSLLKFEGHGHYGAAMRLRYEALADAGFAPPYLGHEEGFGRIRMQTGRHGTTGELSRALLLRMAEYCAWRVRAFPVTHVDQTELMAMARCNLRGMLGSDLMLSLPLEEPVITDSRMQPHKWISTADGRWLKLDGALHGDDHFFPGPCDIAWDMAGLCVEWRLKGDARGLLIGEYTRLTRDRLQARLPDYELAYTAFRMAWTGMAASCMAGTLDEQRLTAEHRRYRAGLEQLLARKFAFTRARCA